jgi:hypothetical protein
MEESGYNRIGSVPEPSVHPDSYPVGRGGAFSRIKLPKRQTGNSPPSSAEIKEFMDLYLHSTIRVHGVVLD